MGIYHARHAVRCSGPLASPKHRNLFTERKVLDAAAASIVAVLLLCVTVACQGATPAGPPAQPTIDPRLIECSDVPEMMPLTEGEREAAIAAGCVGWMESTALRRGEADNIRKTLADRSFRRFSPGRDANPRKGVVLDFFAGLKLYAQYAVDGHAVNEWEMAADHYDLELGDSPNVITLHPVEPRTYQWFPSECGDCVDTTKVSVSVRNVFNPSRMEFRVNDPNRVLPIPFPVFSEWTTFREDEIQQ